MPRSNGEWAAWRFPTAALILAGAWAAPARADDGIPAETLKALKEATIFVKVDAGRLQATGSGFLISKDETTGYIVTNEHVVVPPRGFGGKTAITVVFRSGTKQEQVVKAEVVVLDKVRDLALLKVVDVKDLPAPVDMAKKPELSETMTVYTFGFPFGEALSSTKGNPAVTIGKGTVSSIRENDKGEVTGVQIDGALNPGNSGGPVFDGKGRLVGVAVAGIRGAGIGLAIPSAEVSSLLNGRVAVDVCRTLAIKDGKAELEVEIQVIDPMNKIKAVTVYHADAAMVKEMPKPDKNGRYPALAGAAKIEIKIENQKGTARFILPYEKAAAKFVLQHSYLVREGGGEGEHHYSAPRPFEILDPADVKAQLLGTWKVRVGPDFQTEWTFNADGTVDSTNGGHAHGKWTIDESKQRVLLTWSDREWDSFALPLDPKKTVGDTYHNKEWKVEAVKVK